MSDKTIQNLVSGGIAVMFGFVAFKIIQTQFLGNGSNGDGSLLADAGEPMAGASGVGCGASGAPSTFLEGTSGCDYLHNCEANGGIGWSNAMSGGGYQLGCDNSGLGSINVGSNGGSNLAPVTLTKGTPIASRPSRTRRTRSFF